MKIGLAQMDIAFAEPDTNFEKVSDFVQQAAKETCEVLIFPEMWNTGYALRDLAKLSDHEGKRTKKILSDLAKQYQIAIVAGSVATEREGKFYNTSYTFSRNGKLINAYDKLHLFGLMNEEKYIRAGGQESHFDLAGIASVLVVCYDIRFPEWLRTNIAVNQAEILYVAAEWPQQRIVQWQRLLQARAIENQCFVVAVNRVGKDPDNVYNGHSLVIDPLGEILADAGENENLTSFDLDLSKLANIRGEIPVFNDRRPELYH